MRALDFLAKPDTHGLKPVYAIVGEDPFLRSELLKALAQGALGVNADLSLASRFQGDSAPLSNVLDELRTVPLFEKRRMVVIDAADPFVTAHRKELETYSENPSTTGVLVLLVKSWPSTTKLAKLVEKTGLSLDTKPPTERELGSWLVKWTKARSKAKLDEDAASLLLELIGPEVGLLVSEVEKLAIYVGTRAHIHHEDVSKVVGAGRLETIWQILNAATTGKSADALDEIDRLLSSGENAVGLLAAMTVSLRKVYHAGVLRLRRMEPSVACREAGIPPFAVDMTLKQHLHLGPTRVSRLPDQLLMVDLDLKGNSSLSPRTILERLIVELSQPRSD